MATNQTLEILNTLTLSSLATLHNEYAADANTKSVNKFSDKVAGIRRTVAVLDALQLELVVDAKSARGFVVEGSYTDADHQVDPTEDTLPVALETPLAPVAAVPAPAPRQRSAAVSEEATITLMVIGEKGDVTNPKRKGSEAHARFALYRDGMTVRQYLDAANALGHMSERHKYRADLRWDEAHGFIRIEEAKS